MAILPPRIRGKGRRERVRIARAAGRLHDAARDEVAVAVVVDRDRLRGPLRGALELRPLHARVLAAAVPGAERRRWRGRLRAALRFRRRALQLVAALALGLHVARLRHRLLVARLESLALEERHTDDADVLRPVGAR